MCTKIKKKPSRHHKQSAESRTVVTINFTRHCCQLTMHFFLSQCIFFTIQNWSQTLWFFFWIYFFSIFFGWIALIHLKCLMAIIISKQWKIHYYSLSLSLSLFVSLYVVVLIFRTKGTNFRNFGADWLTDMSYIETMNRNENPLSTKHTFPIFTTCRAQFQFTYQNWFWKVICNSTYIFLLEFSEDLLLVEIAFICQIQWQNSSKYKIDL